VRSRVQVPRTSLRANFILMALGMVVLPQALVIGWSAMERDIAGKLQASTRETANDAEALLWSARVDGLHAQKTLRGLEELAKMHTARIRVVRQDGSVRFEVDRDQGTDLVHTIGTWFFGPDGAPTLRAFDETLGPLTERVEIQSVTRWNAAAPAEASTSTDTGCRTSAGGKLLVCHAARAVAVGDERDAIYVQESSRRAVRALYDLRYHLLRLSVVMVPLALAFSWWMGRRMVRPLQWLRDRVIEKAQSANPRADLATPKGQEVAELADAFNGLLESLDERRRANEAFVADLVHEFKNPVAAIRTCADTLFEGGADQARAARIARILADSSSRLDALVSQFLELARAEAGMPNEARVTIDFAALVRGIATFLCVCRARRTTRMATFRHIGSRQRNRTRVRWRRVRRNAGPCGARTVDCTLLSIERVGRSRSRHWLGRIGC
jgi:two-component system sensor histidine kinase ChvG